MSVHEPPQFTPAQILAAGHRAEGEGRYDFARQFFKHLIDNYPATPEAGVAGQAMDRMARAQAQAPVPTNHAAWQPSPPLGQPPEPSHFKPQMQQGSFGEPGHGGYGGGPGNDGWPQPEPMPATSAGGQVERRSIELPPPVRDYLAGRFLARLMAWLGLLQMVAGLGLLPIVFLSPRSLAGLPIIGMLAAGGPTLPAAIMLAGLIQVLLGQLVRAILDSANAARDVAAITRAKASPRPAPEGRGRRR